MYISGIIQYMIWPVFIVASWFIIKAALKYYEKKFTVTDEESGSEKQL
jgi:hypothetical protein